MNYLYLKENQKVRFGTYLIKKNLSDSDKEFAVSFDEDSLLTAQYDVDAQIRLADMTDSEYSTSGEQVAVNFAYACFYGPTMENPYATYQNTMAK